MGTPAIFVFVVVDVTIPDEVDTLPAFDSLVDQ